MIAAWKRRVAGLCGAIAVAFMLLCFPPGRYDFYPRCPVYEMFHVNCPGCGATRALAALLQGRVLEALHWNALFTVGLPFCVIYGLACSVSGRRWVQPGPIVVCGGFAVALGFMVLRNLPYAGFWS